MLTEKVATCCSMRFLPGFAPSVENRTSRRWRSTPFKTWWHPSNRELRLWLSPHKRRTTKCILQIDPWLVDFEIEHADDWDKKIARDSRPGRRLERVRKDIAEGRTNPTRY